MKKREITLIADNLFFENKPSAWLGYQNLKIFKNKSDLYKFSNFYVAKLYWTYRVISVIIYCIV